MSRLRIVFVALLLCIASPVQDALAINHNCQEVFCSFRCQVFGDYKGYCVWTPVTTTGCIQYFGPQCASLQNAYCCTRETSGAF
jgi:hypothetical protein